MTAGNSVFQRKEGAGWNRGLDNLLNAELGRWFRTNKWWIQILVWTALINLILLLAAVSEDSGDGTELALIFGVLLGIFAPCGVCILMQGSVVGEKQSGTAAWVLSKPVSRPAFILAKLVGNTAGVAATIVLVQGLIAYLIIYLVSGTVLPPLGFLVGLAVHLVHLFFYITLSLMLGAAFSRRGAVIAIPLVFVFLQQLLMGLFPVLSKVLPSTLVVPPDSGQYTSLAMSLMTSSGPFLYLPLATTIGASVLFVVIAIWVFGRLEF